MRFPKFLKITSASLLGLVLVYILLPGYLQKGLRYYTADIDDYKIFDNRDVVAGSYIPWHFSDSYNNYKLTKGQIDSFEKYQTVAFLVIQNNEILFEQYWENYDSLSLSNSFSMAKTIVSLLTGAAIDEGKIHSLDDPVGKYLPHFSEGENKALTIRNLLTMSSGLNWDEAYASPFSKTTIAYYGDNLEKLMMSLDVVEPPGKTFTYYSANSQLMAFVLQAATGKTLGEYASGKLWQPLGASENALWSLDRENGMEKAYCCFNSNARDFARLGSLVLDSGMFNGNPIISKEYIEKLVTPATNLVTPTGNQVDFYGLSIWLMDFRGNTVYYFRGILGQYIFIVPSKNMVVVRLGKKRSKNRVNNAPADVNLYLSSAFDIINNN